MANNRIIRVTQEIRRELAHIITNEVKDDRLHPMTSIVDIHVTGDLKYAQVLISVYDKDDKKRIASVDALNHAASFIRTRLAKTMSFRTVPKLTFELDTNIEYGFEIEKKLQEVLNNK